MSRYLLSRSRVGGMLFALLALASGQAWSVGLGEIELSSALNEELKAEIELLDTAELSPAEILVTLASSEDFERVGVERFFFLTDLDFEVLFANDGSASVTVSSSRPITEPYLNFIVEVRWPSGRLLREFTLLLDPPTFSEAAAPTVAAPVESRRNPASSGRVQREPQTAAGTGTRVQVAPRERAAGPSPLDEGVVGDQFRMTDRNDTLWSIASRTRPSGSVSVQQTMLAIQRLNPEAFINGNINLMKAGYTLKLPDEAEVRSLSQEQAVATVNRHNELWRSGAATPAPAAESAQPAQVAQAADQTSRLRSPVDATERQAAAPAAEEAGGELRIVAGQGDSATGRATEAASQELNQVLEENDRLNRENSELTYRLDAQQELSESQIAVKDRQLEVKDQQIAQLQQQLADARQQQAQAAQQPAPAETPQAQNQSTETANWWENPMVMYGGAGVLVLALVGGMLFARRRRETEEDFFEAAEPTISDEDTLTQEAFIDEDDEAFAEPETALDSEFSEDDDDERPDSETSDVIGEADIYIAYGRYPQAIGLLLGVLEEDPGRNDVRLKLLELYSETNDREAFDTHLAQLVEHCDDEEALLSARELESRFGEKSISLEEVLADDDAAAESNIEEDEAPGPLELASDAEAPAAVAEVEAAPAGEDAGFELELDELDTTAEAGFATEAEAEDKGAGDQLGGDLGIDFDPDRDVAEEELEPEPVAAATVGDEDRIDLDDMGLGTELDSLGDGAGGAQTLTATEADDDLALAEDDDFDFQDEGDSANTKLDLARAYIDMGDADGARDILKEVLDEGNSEQQQQAQSMLDAL